MSLSWTPRENSGGLFKQHPELVIDHPTRQGHELYGPIGLMKTLDQWGVRYYPLNQHKMIDDKYPTSEQINNQLRSIAWKYPQIFKLEELGKGRRGKRILMLKVSDNVQVDEVEPEVKLIANMHGDEIVGREIVVRLAEYIGLAYSQKNPEIRELVDNAEIYLVASMNPEGADKRRRGNSTWTDLNRNFPDFTTRDNQNSPDGREPETKAIMEWQSKRNFALSANFHGGAEVVNYPWDTIGDRHPLHELVRQISLDYAAEIPSMRDSYEFPNGVTNGYDWYEVNGGMQDWSYYWHNDLQITVEVSDEKWHDYKEVKRYWNDHRQPMINFLKMVFSGSGVEVNEPSKVSVYQIEDNKRGIFWGVTQQ